jgi:glycosyltransferase involved in cell wall biosynthesis
VLSVQGLLAECGKVYNGRMSFRELLKAHAMREICHRGGIFGGRRQFTRRSIMEQTMLRGMKHIIGRTLWDRAHIREIHPEAEYHHCDELLRPPFYSVMRNPDLFRRHSICVATAFYPLKGLHVLLRAAALLTRDFPELSIRIPDSRRIQTAPTTGYSRYLQSMIRELHLGEHMDWMDPLNDRGVADLLSDSHLFVNPSFMENSSNSLAEAMIVGVPAIAGYAGGNPSMLRDRETGLLFPAGDHALLAEDIRLLFVQEGFADRLAAKARVEALARHDCARVGAALVEIYLSIAGAKSGVPAR